MSEQKPKKKVVSRTVAIALGIICIILVVGLVGAIADYRSILNRKDNTITTISARARAGFQPSLSKLRDGFG
jgi:Trk-type K+ transport system membrane component